MKYFPFLFQLEQKCCLIVGGGNVGLRRYRALQAAGAVIDVISSEFLPQLRELMLQSPGETFAQNFDSSLIRKDYFCVVAAT